MRVEIADVFGRKRYKLLFKKEQDSWKWSLKTIKYDSQVAYQ